MVQAAIRHDSSLQFKEASRIIKDNSLPNVFEAKVKVIQVEG